MGGVAGDQQGSREYDRRSRLYSRQGRSEGVQAPVKVGYERSRRNSLREPGGVGQAGKGGRIADCPLHVHAVPVDSREKIPVRRTRHSDGNGATGSVPGQVEDHRLAGEGLSPELGPDSRRSGDFQNLCLPFGECAGAVRP